MVGVLLVAALTGCTAAAAQGQANSAALQKAAVQLVLDNQPAGTGAGYVINGKVYLSPEAAAIALGRRVTADGETVKFYRQPVPPHIHIQELPKDFHDQVQAALDLLQVKAPDQYRLVMENLELVVLGGGNANMSFAETNTVSVLRGQSLTWVAATLAHEAEHIRTAHTNPDLARDIRANEMDAYRVSLETLKLIGAPSFEIEREERYAENPPAAE